MVDNTGYLFRARIIIIVAVTFFVASLNFANEPKILQSSYFEQQKIPPPKTTTFAESSGHELSHGGTLDMCPNTKISS